MSRVAFLLCVLHCILMPATRCSASGQATVQDVDVLRSVKEIHVLSDERLPDRVPVDLECVVGYYSRDWPILFLHDGVAGIYAGGPNNEAIKTGDHVRVRGVVGPGRYVIDYTIERSENQIQLPPARKESFEKLNSGQDDSQFIEIQGQLVSLQTDNLHTALEMNAVEGGRFRALIDGSSMSVAELRPMLGRQLRLRGIVGGRFDTKGSFIGFQLWLADTTAIEPVTSDGSDVVSVTTIADLQHVPQVPGAASFFRILGRMDYQISEHMILVHDSTGTQFVELQVPAQVPVGKSFEINGVLDNGLIPPILRYGELTETQETLPAAPKAPLMSISNLVAENLSGQIVSTSGEFVSAFSIGTDHGFLLQSERHLLPVFIQDGLSSDVQSGTKIDVTGVWVQQRSLEGFNIGSCALYSRNDGIRIGSQFPWKVMIALSTVGVVALLSFFWAVTLRRQVKVQTKRALKAFAERRQLEDRYASVFMHAKVMVITADVNGLIVAANPATTRITGRATDSLIGHPLTEIVHPDFVTAIEDMMRSSMQSSDSRSSDVQILRPDASTIPLEVSFWSMHDDSGTTIQSIWHDISHRLQMEQQKNEFASQMLSVQKMESLGVLAGGIAHDFNNLLTVILGNASMIGHDERSRTFDRERVACIEQAASRAADLTQQMLAYAGKGKFDVRAINLAVLINEMSSLLMASVPKSTQLSLPPTQNLQAVMADATQMQQVIMNLVLNGSESLNRQSGSVEVHTSVVQAKAGELSDCVINFTDNASTLVQLRVCDTGQGMDAETTRRIFDPFYTTKFSGRGLGLSTVLGIVRGHKGAIRVTSTPGAGTCFEILLPATNAACTPSAASKPGNPAGMGSGSLLVIDDEPAMLALLCRTLELAGFKVRGLERPTEAVELMSNPSVNFDCIITDMTMPEMHGDELARRIRATRPHIPIVLCSGFNVSEDYSATDQFVSAFLKKPFKNQQLVELVLRLIAESKSSG